MFDDILGDNIEAEERKIKRHLQDIVDILDYSTVTNSNVVQIWDYVYKWMVNVYGGDWEEDYEVLLDWNKQDKKYFIDVRSL
jgi:hypothetical protein